MKEVVASLFAIMLLLLPSYYIASNGASSNTGSGETSAPEVYKLAFKKDIIQPSSEEIQKFNQGLMHSNLPGPPVTVSNEPIEGPKKGTDTNISLIKPAASKDTFRVFVNNKVTSLPIGYSGEINEPSLGNKDDVVFYTGNWYAARSADAGLTWEYVDTYEDMIDFCCDQDVIYDSNHGIFLWYRQALSDVNGENYFRLGVSTDALTWWFYNLAPTDFNGSWDEIWFDYPHIAVGDNYFYVGTNVFDVNDNFERTVMIRLSLEDLAAAQPVSFYYYTSTTLGTFTPVQGATDTMYFASHLSNTYMKVFKWPEASASVSAFSIKIPAWKSGFPDCPDPQGINWCARSDDRLTGGWIDNEDGIIGFIWNVAQGYGFDWPYVNAATFTITGTSPKYLGRPYVWSDDFAWIYGHVSPNARGHVGIVAAFGGGAFYPSVAVGVDDDLTVGSDPWQLEVALIGTASATAIDANDNAYWGDYLRVRPYNDNENIWIASGYTKQDGVGVESNYLIFGRDRDYLDGVGEPPDNTAPVANAGQDKNVKKGSTVKLDATSSTDADEDELTYSWDQTAGPEVALSDSTAEQPTFTAPEVDVETVLTFELVVNDGIESSTADSVSITVLPLSISSFTLSHEGTAKLSKKVGEFGKGTYAVSIEITGEYEVNDNGKLIIDSDSLEGTVSIGDHTHSLDLTKFTVAKNKKSISYSANMVEMSGTVKGLVKFSTAVDFESGLDQDSVAAGKGNTLTAKMEKAKFDTKKTSTATLNFS